MVKVKSATVLILFFFSIAIVAGWLIFFLSGRRVLEPQLAAEVPLEFSESELAPFLKIGFESADELAHWKAHHFKGQSEAEIISDAIDGMILSARSSGSSSLLLHEADVSVENRPHLSWEWRVLEFPSGKENNEFGVTRDSDYGARVYVVFRGLTPFTSDTIQYIWDDHFQAGTYRSSPAGNHVKLFVIRSGSSGAEGWVKEIRDIVKDYETLFGRKPRSPIHAVGVMSDSDNTGTNASAQFRNIKILVPHGVSIQPTSQNWVQVISFSISERLLFLRKANEAGLSLIKESRDGFFHTFDRIRSAVSRRFSFSAE